MPRKCIFGCPPATRGKIHVFPNQRRFPEQFKAWVERVPQHRRPPQNDFHNQRVCDRHFTEQDRNRFNRLNALAVPTLYLDLPQEFNINDITLSRPDVSVVLEDVDNSSQLPINENLPQEFNINDSDLSTPVVPVVLEDLDNSSQLPINEDLPQEFNINDSDLSRPDVLNEAFLDTSSQLPMNVDLPQEFNNNDSDISLHYVTLDHDYCVPRTQSNPVNVSVQVPMKAPTASKKSINKYRMYQRNIKNLRREIYRLRSKCKTLKTRLENAENFYDKSDFQKIFKNMTSAAQTFTKMQMQTPKHKKGRRFTLDEKILSLSLFKKSPKCYNLMTNLFTLPSAKSMKRLLSQVKLGPGTDNKLIFEDLKKKVAEMNISDKLCCLIFDEMSITPQIQYDCSKDEFKGFVTQGGKKKIANHALVFMVKGIQKQYKQPVAYYFTNSINTFELKNIIKDVIQKIHQTGLLILCTVCDQSTVNVSAIKELIKDTNEIYIKKKLQFQNDHFKIGKQKVIPIFDTPHLLKGLRNNLLSKNLIYTDFDDKNKTKTVKWDFFNQLYLADKSFGELRLLQKLTDEHVVPEKIKKMRVKMAAQVFSHSTAVAAEHLSARGVLQKDCRNIIPFVLTIDNLFDSLNINTYTVPNGKMYKGPIKKHSVHHELWVKALKMLKSIKFVKTDKDNNNLSETVPPTIKNFITTIEGFQQLFKILSEKYSFDTMLTRNINQDPVENFFGNIRSYGSRNIAPNSVAFEGAYKSLLLNNYNSPQSLRANCESDNNYCLQNLDFFFKNKNPPPLNTPNVAEKNINIPLISFDFKIAEDQGQSDYVCGWVLKKCLTNIVKSCKKCRSNLLCTRNNMQQNSFIRAKEYFKNKSGLCYPSMKLIKCFREIQHICVTMLKKKTPTHGIKGQITMYSNLYVEFPFECDKHMEMLKLYFIEITSKVIIYSWCRSINRILCGKMAYNGDDEIKNLALNYYNKHKHSKT